MASILDEFSRTFREFFRNNAAPGEAASPLLAAAPAIAEAARLWQGSRLGMTPVVTTPAGTYWLPALGVELSADLSSMATCSAQTMLARARAGRERAAL